MSILKKFNFFAVLVCLILLSSVVWTINALINHTYLEIERGIGERNVTRVSHAKTLMLESLDTKLVDWAWWDDTYDYLSDKNEEYELSNLSHVALESLKLSSMLFFDEEKRLVKAISLDKAGELVETNIELLEHFNPESSLFEIANDEGNKTGLLSDNDDIYAFSIRPVLRGDKAGPRAGYIVFVQSYIWQIEQIEEVLLLKINYDYGEEFEYTGDYWLDIGESVIVGHLKLEDYQSRTLGLINFEVQREVSLVGKASLDQMLLILASVIVASTIVYYLMLRKLVIDKLIRLNSQVEQVRMDMQGNVRIEEFKGDDELSQLTININQMLARLQSTTEMSKSGNQNVKKYIDVVGVMIVALDKNGDLLLINKRAAEVLGVDQEKSVGMNWFDNFLMDDQKDEMKKVFRQLMKGKVEQVENLENKISTPAGVRLIAWHNSLMRDENGEIVATLSAGEDITDRRKKDEETKEHMREIEKLNELMVDREVKMAEMKDKLKNI